MRRKARASGVEQVVAQLLESLMNVAFRTGAIRLRSSPREPALRKARVCYDHLAGELGVLMYDSLAERGAFAFGGDGVALTDAGRGIVHELGIDMRWRAGAGRSAAPASIGASGASTWPARWAMRC